MIPCVRYSRVLKLQAKGDDQHSHTIIVCKYCFEEIHLPV